MNHYGHNSRLWTFGVWMLLLSLLPTLAVTASAGGRRSRATPAAPQVPAAPQPASDTPQPALDNAPASDANNQQPAATSFDRYAIIIQRKPFGDEAVAAAMAAAAAAQATAAESFAKNLKLCAITKNHFNGKVQVGLVDTATKKSYFLYEGDSEDGIELKEADYQNEKARLAKGGEEIWLDMAEVKTAPAVVVPGGGVSTPPLVGRRGYGMPAAPAQPPPAAPAQPQKPRLTGEALQKHLQEYQMELIRAGGSKGPPLPMALTPEMDAQLVKEGALPPQE